ncbi:BTAD domain-containing putative transcriptional regulator [Streptomyces mirabilis]|nr:BTAD domain-containing putative transcriptional regulator [Streptomyces mirabilis]
MWQGPVATGIGAEVRAHAAFGLLSHEYVTAVREAADAALLAGLPGTVLPALRRAAAEHPLDEPLLSRLILALAADTRRAEALSTYREACARLAGELGIDAGPQLREAHRTVLLNDPGTAATDLSRTDLAETGAVTSEADETGPGSADPRTPPVPAPAQLPHDLPTFTGREPELDETLGPLTGERAPAETVVISAIGGMAGIGKTTLAVHWAHQVADRFPDGQLYVNLRGFDPSGAVMNPAEAVRGFLDTLGVPPERVPHGVDAQAALYRSLLAGRRFLVLLDNARDTDQVKPLLPGTPGCLTIVTSRNQLSGLVAAHGARSLTLRPSTPTRPAPSSPGGWAPRASTPSPGPWPRSPLCAPDCRSPWPASPPARPPTPTSRCRRSPPNCARHTAVWRPSPAPTPRRTSARSSPGPLAAALPRPPGSSGCSPCIPAPTSGRGRPRRTSCARNPAAADEPTGVRLSTNTLPAGTPSTTCCVPTPPNSSAPRTPRRTRRGRAAAVRALSAHRPRGRSAARPARGPDAAGAARSRASPSRSPTTPPALAWLTAEHAGCSPSSTRPRAPSHDRLACSLAWSSSPSSTGAEPGTTGRSSGRPRSMPPSGSGTRR